MPHGVVTAKSLLQFGMSLVLLSRITKILSLPNSMPLSTKLMVLRLKDIQLSPGTQKATKLVSHSMEKEISLL
jgi:hypothetical protein